MSLIDLFSFCRHSSRESSMSWVCTLLGLSHLRKKHPISREIARIQSSIVNYCENSIYYFLFRQCFNEMSFLQHIPDGLKGFGETEVCYINSFVWLFKRYTKAWRQTTYLVKGNYIANYSTFYNYSSKCFCKFWYRSIKTDRLTSRSWLRRLLTSPN